MEALQISSVSLWPLLSQVSPSLTQACMQGCVWNLPAESPLHHSGNEAPAAEANKIIVQYHTKQQMISAIAALDCSCAHLPATVLK